MDIPIPGNDDSMRSIDVIVRELCQAVSAGKAGRTPDAEGTEQPTAEESAAALPRRSTRAMFRAGSEGAAGEAAPDPPTPQTEPVTTTSQNPAATSGT